MGLGEFSPCLTSASQYFASAIVLFSNDEGLRPKLRSNRQIAENISNFQVFQGKFDVQHCESSRVASLLRSAFLKDFNESQIPQLTSKH